MYSRVASRLPAGLSPLRNMADRAPTGSVRTGHPYFSSTFMTECFTYLEFTRGHGHPLSCSAFTKPASPARMADSMRLAVKLMLQIVCRNSTVSAGMLMWGSLVWLIILNMTAYSPSRRASSKTEGLIVFMLSCESISGTAARRYVTRWRAVS